MLRKNRGQSFGGIWVFPGGKVEPGDERPGRARRRTTTPAAPRCARRPRRPALALDDADLVPFAHWVPPEEAPKRFSTWFFVAALPAGAADVVVDGGEIGDHVWTTPAGALERHAAGEVELAPPTWVTLHSLAEVGRPDGRRRAGPRASDGRLLLHAHRRHVDDQLVAVWAPDAGYESGDLDAPGPRHRLVMATPAAGRSNAAPDRLASPCAIELAEVGARRSRAREVDADLVDARRRGRP